MKILSPFALTPESLHFQGSDGAVIHNCLKSLADIWKRQGVLLIDSQGRFMGEIKHVLESTDINFNAVKKIEVLLREMRMRMVEAETWAAPPFWHTHQEDAATPAECIAVHQNEVASWGIDPETGHADKNGKSLCRIDYLNTSDWAHTETTQVFPKGTRTQEILDLFVYVFALYAGNRYHTAVFIDRYAGKELIRKKDKAGLVKFLEVFSRQVAARGGHIDRVEIFTSANIPENGQTVFPAEQIFDKFALLRPGLALDSVREIVVRTNDDLVFTDYAHDRFARFEDFAVQIGAGFSVFGRSALGKSVTFAKINQADVILEIEKALSQGAAASCRAY